MLLRSSARGEHGCVDASDRFEAEVDGGAQAHAEICQSDAVEPPRRPKRFVAPGQTDQERQRNDVAY